MKKTVRTVLVVLLALAGLSAYAQRHQPPDPAQRIQRRVNILAEKLGLSPEQQQQAITIFTNAASSGKSAEGQMKTAHENLQAAVAKNDSVAIDQAANAMANLIAQSISTHAKAEAAFYQTLTPDQQSKYAEMRHGPGVRGFLGVAPFGPDGPEGPPPF